MGGKPTVGYKCWGEAFPCSFCGCAVLNPGALNLKKEGAQMPGVNHQMSVPVSLANNNQALPYDSLNPHTTPGCRHACCGPPSLGKLRHSELRTPEPMSA